MRYQAQKPVLSVYFLIVVEMMYTKVNSLILKFPDHWFTEKIKFTVKGKCKSNFVPCATFFSLTFPILKQVFASYLPSGGQFFIHFLTFIWFYLFYLCIYRCTSPTFNLLSPPQLTENIRIFNKLFMFYEITHTKCPC